MYAHWLLLGCIMHEKQGTLCDQEAGEEPCNEAKGEYV